MNEFFSLPLFGPIPFPPINFSLLKRRVSDNLDVQSVQNSRKLLTKWNMSSQVSIRTRVVLCCVVLGCGEVPFSLGDDWMWGSLGSGVSWRCELAEVSREDRSTSLQPPASLRKALLDGMLQYLLVHLVFVVTETMWPAKPKRLLSGPLRKSFASTLGRFYTICLVWNKAFI